MSGSFLLTMIGYLFGSVKVLNLFTLAELITALKTPQGQAAISSGGEVIKKLAANGKPIAQAVITYAAMVARIHQMTPEEEKIWADRGMLPVDQNHDFPQAGV